MAKTEINKTKAEKQAETKPEVKTHFSIKNKVTGYIYKLQKEDVDRLITEEPHNFEVIDKDYIKPNIEPEFETVYSQIVEDKN